MVLGRAERTQGAPGNFFQETQFLGLAMPHNSMESAWAAGRRLGAVVAVGLALSAAFIEAETLLHWKSGFLHVLAVFIAFLLSVILVHGFEVLEPLGF